MNYYCFPYKGEDIKTITTKNKSEHTQHKQITQQIGAIVFFTDTYAS